MSGKHQFDKEMLFSKESCLLIAAFCNASKLEYICLSVWHWIRVQRYYNRQYSIVWFGSCLLCWECYVIFCVGLKKIIFTLPKKKNESIFPICASNITFTTSKINGPKQFCIQIFFHEHGGYKIIKSLSAQRKHRQEIITHLSQQNTNQKMSSTETFI